MKRMYFENRKGMLHMPKKMIFVKRLGTPRMSKQITCSRRGTPRVPPKTQRIFLLRIICFLSILFSFNSLALSYINDVDYAKISGLSYFNPLQFIEDLTATKTFSKLAVEKNSLAVYPLPIVGINPKTNLVNKTLLIFILQNVPEKWSLNFQSVGVVGVESESDVVIDNDNFHKITTSDAGMCHQNKYEFYFTKQKDIYRVFEFILSSICVGVDDTRQIAYDYNLETKDFSSIIKEHLNGVVE